jgi:hypothetical protein
VKKNAKPADIGNAKKFQDGGKARGAIRASFLLFRIARAWKPSATSRLASRTLARKDAPALDHN